MPLTNNQDIPEKPRQASEPWTIKKLFPFKATVSALTKSFTNSFDILLCFLVLIIGVSELIGNKISWMLYILTTFILVASLIQRKEFYLKEKIKKKK